MNTYIHVCVYKNIHICVYTNIHIYVYTNIHICIYEYVCMHNICIKNSFFNHSIDGHENIPTFLETNI